MKKAFLYEKAHLERREHGVLPKGPDMQRLPVRERRSAASRYGAAIGWVALALLVRVALDPLLDDQLPFTTFFAGIAAAAWFGGLGPSLLSTALGYVAAELFTVHHGQARWFATPLDFGVAGSYFLVASAIAYVSQEMRRTRDSAIARQIELEWVIGERIQAEEALRQARDELDLRVRERTAELDGTLRARERDIAEMRRAQAKLSEQAALLQLAHDAILVIDLDGKISLWNRGAEEIYGWRPDEAVGRNAHDLLRTTFPIPLDEIGAVLHDQGQWAGELTHTTRSGQTVAVASRWSLQQDLEGKPGAVLEINRDITERKRTEENLRRANAYNRSLIEASLDPLVTISPGGRITDVNTAAENITGVPRAELIGTDFSDFFTDPEAARAGYQQVFREGWVQDYALEVRRRGGFATPVLYNASVYRNETGAVVGVFAAARDISERKRAERVLEDKTNELARSNAELQQFAYVASHDLQEPLRMVANFTQLLADRYGDKLDQDAREFIGYAVEGATRMQTLIQDLLALSRVGTRGMKFAPVRLDDALGGAMANLEFAIRESGALVSHDELPAVKADSSQMVQLFQNLISNGIKFKSEGPPRMHVSAVRNGTGWTFSVRDNGIGFEPQYAEQIFAVFRRLHARDEYPGTGMGLAICKKIVERHHGRIWAESKPGSGSAFFFTIPGAASPAKPGEEEVGAV